MLSQNLEKTLREAYQLATNYKHEYVTLEHLLYSLLEDQDAISVLKACAVDISNLKENVEKFIINDLENLSKSNNLISDLLLKLPLLQVGQFAIPLIGFSLMALLLQALLPSRKVPLKPLLPGSFLIGIGLTTLNLAVSKSILSLGVRFQAHGFIGGFLVLTLWVWLLGVILYFGQCWSVVIASMTLLNKKRNYK